MRVASPIPPPHPNNLVQVVPEQNSGKEDDMVISKPSNLFHSVKESKMSDSKPKLVKPNPEIPRKTTPNTKKSPVVKKKSPEPPVRRSSRLRKPV